MPDTFRDIEFAGPATYRIIVQGALAQRWSDRLAGMAITTVDRGSRAPHTFLAGTVRDQAELLGVLDNLYEMHLPILVVMLVDG